MVPAGGDARPVGMSGSGRQLLVERTTLTDGAWVGEFDPDGMLVLDEALDKLEPRQRQVVECRFFGGVEEQEIAAALSVAERTVHRDWVKARAWLYRYFYPDPTP
jgi:DNA-directed RNA polymerase specialized sigma24 family protein